jgi:endonuclease YncB( thermonuclease family)
MTFGFAGLALAAAMAAGLVPQSGGFPRGWLPETGRSEPAFELTGRATVIDGDTIELHGRRIRLFWIDAPESAQICQSAAGHDYRCGQQAALALADRIGTATVRCTKKDIDRYNRIVAVCRVGDIDLGDWLVSQGHAVAFRRYSKDYVAEEDRARSARRGMWAGTFTMPWEWRAGKS